MGKESAVKSELVEGLSIFVEAAEGEKCQRCWKYFTVPDSEQGNEICNRCAGALELYNATE